MHKCKGTRKHLNVRQRIYIEVAIKRGDRIAQLVFQKIEHVQFELSNNLTSTNRSSGGFGHTGV